MENPNLLSRYFNVNTLTIFFVITGIYALSLTLEFNLVFSDDFYYESILDKDKTATHESISYFIAQDRETEWVNYPIIIAVVLLPSVFIGLALFIGSVLKENKFKYKDFFSVALKSQLVFALNYLIAVVLKWQKLLDRDFYNINNNYDFQSLLVFFDIKNLLPELFYPLQSINIAEFVHIIFLSFGVSFLLQVGYFKALGFTVIFYGSALLFWVILTVFLQITL